MKETIIDIPNYKELEVLHIVLDYNGTIAKDGHLDDAVKKILPKLTKSYQVHVITADTFGTVQRELKEYDVSVKILSSNKHTLEKAEFIQSLDASKCVAIGNGNNDALMLEQAKLGIALLGAEGCSTQNLLKSDLVCRSIEEALELLLYPQRLIATLRR